MDLAENAGVGLRFVRDMEQGKQTLQMDKVNQVLRIFGEEMAPSRMVEYREARILKGLYMFRTGWEALPVTYLDKNGPV